MSEDKSENQIEIIVPDELAGQRLDKILAELFPDYSRSRLQQWLKDGCVSVDGQILPGKQKLDGGESLLAQFPEEEELGEAEPENIPLDIIYEDEHLFVINKPVGMVVHPAVGNRTGTLQNGLLFLDPSLASVPRAGIVHRLDKDTSGLLVVARTHKAHKLLVEQLQARTVSRTYHAVCFGQVIAGGTVKANIGRHSVDRKKMAVKQVGGKEAITHYFVEQRFRHHTHVRCKLETGRTHQIRVHMAHIGKPLVGDPTYGGRLRIPGDAMDDLKSCLHNFSRQALHAAELGLVHPETGEEMIWKAPLPEDMDLLLFCLEQDSADYDDYLDEDEDDWDDDDYDVEVVYADE